MENRNEQNRQQLWLGYAACALASSLWGTGFYFGRLALNEMSVEAMVLYRFLFACLVVVPLALAHRMRRSTSTSWTKADVRLLLIATAFGIPVQFLLQFQGLAHTTVSHASLMVGAMPVLLAVAAAIFVKERLERIGWLALLASTVGTGLIVLSIPSASGQTAHGNPSLAGDLLVLASMVVALVWILLNKRLMQRHSASEVTAYSILSGTGMLALVVLGPWLLGFQTNSPLPLVHAVSRTAWLALAFSGIFCTAATTLLWNWGIHHVPASRAGVLLNLEPALGSWLGVALLGEHLGPFAWLGGGLILAAAVTLTTRNHEARMDAAED